MKAAWTLLAAAALPASLPAQLPPPILDVHMHALPAGSQGPPPLGMCLPATSLGGASSGRAWAAEFGARNAAPPCDAPTWSPETDEELMVATLEIMERRNIIGVTSGPRRDRWMEHAGDRIIPGTRAFMNLRPAPPLDSLRREIETGSVQVLAEVTIQYAGIEPASEEFAPYLALAEELDIAVGVHAGPGPPGAPYLFAPRYRGRLHSPLLYEEVLVRHPELRLYLMHAGWPMLDDLLALMWAHPQVHVGLGVISWGLPPAEFHRYLRRIVEAGFGDRVMFGSDHMVWPGALEFAISNIESADYLTDEQKRDILYNNAARFLRLTEEEIAAHHGR